MVAKTKQTKISDLDVASAVIAHEAVDCFCGIEHKPTEQPKELVSCIGGSFYGTAGEAWPTTASGKPLIPWLQIVCTEMKNLYGAFDNRKSVCFYLREDMFEFEAISSPESGDFVVREYALEDELVPLTRPAELLGHSFHQLAWKQQKDYPSVSKYYGLFEEHVYDAICDMKNFDYENQSGIKIGGWPTPVQQDQEYPGTWDLQIDMTENFMYADSGIGYLSRSANHWYVRFECC